MARIAILNSIACELRGPFVIRGRLAINRSSVPSEEVIRLNECSDSIQLTLRRLDHLEETVPEEQIEVSEPGTWRIRTEKLTPGFYLATAMYSSSGEYLRPLSLCVRGADIPQIRIEESDPTEMFQAATNLYQKADRKKAWTKFFEALENDPHHPGWSQVDSLLELAKEFPISTFEAIATMVRHPNIMGALPCFDRGKNGFGIALKNYLFCGALSRLPLGYGS